MSNVTNTMEQPGTPVNNKSSRKVIGRTLLPRNLDSSPIVKDMIFTLRSGKKAAFKSVHFTHEELTNDTFVKTVVNGREQDGLTEEGVADIRRTLKLQQFQLCIGRKIADKTEFLDGSRRRFCAILDRLGLDVLVTEDEISIADAKGLAEDIQTSKEHNIREIGLPLLIQERSGMTQRDIAADNNMSQAKVARSLQAAKVPSLMLKVFPIRNELNYPDYKLLLDISRKLEKKGLEIAELVSSVKDEAFKLEKSLAADDYKDEILSFYRTYSDLYLDKPAAVNKVKPTVTPLIEFKDSSMYARKRVNDRETSFSFNRLSNAAQKDLEEALLVVLKTHYPS